MGKTASQGEDAVALNSLLVFIKTRHRRHKTRRHIGNKRQLLFIYVAFSLCSSFDMSLF